MVVLPTSVTQLTCYVCEQVDTACGFVSWFTAAKLISWEKIPGSPSSYDVLEGRAWGRGDAHHAVVQTHICSNHGIKNFDFIHCLACGKALDWVRDWREIWSLHLLAE